MSEIRIGRWGVDEDDDGEIDAYYSLFVDGDLSRSGNISPPDWRMERQPVNQS